MIVKMSKLYVVVRKSDSDRLVKKFHQLGVVHLVPIDASLSGAEEKTVIALDNCNRVIQVLSSVKSEGTKPDISVVEAIDEIMSLQKSEAEQVSSLSALYPPLGQQRVWVYLGLVASH